ncbi:hypothetical protein [Nitrobacter hamburgensis]|uniref:hypothetical protein n=1 Tax=Nitrobacter hamburgensis TaxID=912 RepID=UPI00059BF67A|nr:hypothetical protein [Nitrobacter hamburgensis]
MLNRRVANFTELVWSTVGNSAPVDKRRMELLGARGVSRFTPSVETSHKGAALIVAIALFISTAALWSAIFCGA